MDVTVTKQTIDARHGRYVVRVPGFEAEGELTFTTRGPKVISADHTGVPEALGGRGIGRALIDAMLADAQQSGFKIIPLCSYIRAQYAKHPEWADLFTTAPGENPTG